MPPNLALATQAAQHTAMLAVWSGPTRAPRGSWGGRRERLAMRATVQTGFLSGALGSTNTVALGGQVLLPHRRSSAGPHVPTPRLSWHPLLPCSALPPSLGLGVAVAMGGTW